MMDLVFFFSQVSLQQDSYNEGYYYHICGGTIIDAFHVMTAAHCIFGLGHYIPAVCTFEPVTLTSVNILF